MKSQVWPIALIMTLAILLAGCSGEEGSSQSSPDYEHTYDVTHFSLNGDIIGTYRATKINSYEGCFYFRYESQESGEEDPTICGNVLAVPVDRVDPKDYDKSVDPIYEIRQLRADGTVFKTHNATWFRAYRGCIHFRAPQYPFALNDPVICGNVIAQKKPQ